MSLLYRRNIGGASWIQQFLAGVPLVDTLGQRSAFSTSTIHSHASPIDPSQLRHSSSARFTERVRRPGPKNGSALWDGALDQRKSWIGAASLLNTDGGGEAFTLANRLINVSFRFGFGLAEELRACDVLRRDTVNLACTVLTPTKLAPRGHLSEMCKMAKHTAHDWRLFKAEHEHSYKHLPINWGHSSLAAIALRPPSDGRWYGFRSRTAMFGAIADVAHYNIPLAS